jgi:hypothetical protein
MVFGPQNEFRIKVARMTDEKLFDNTILCIIVLSSIGLIAENPLTDPTSKFI